MIPRSIHCVLIALTLAGFARADETPKSDAAKKRVVGILIFDGVEALDFCGPYEVFSLAHVHEAGPHATAVRWSALWHRVPTP